MSAMEPTVALVFSPEQWVEELHRHLAHHGGARVRQIVVEPAVALDEEYDVLVVSDRWPALTLGFVGAIHERGRRVLGVFDAEEPAGKDHLLRLGVDATVPGDAPMPEFVTALAGLEVGVPCSTDRDVTTPVSENDLECGTLLAVSGPRGGGITEVAVGLAVALANRRSPVVLVDAHEAAPAIGGRLGLGLEPNLRGAVDARAHGLGAIDDTIVAPGPLAPRSLGVLSGFPSPVAAAQVSPREVLDVLRALRQRHSHVVVDVDDTSSVADALIEQCTAVVVVVGASPVGVVRALEWLARRRPEASGRAVHVAVNRAPGAHFRREEIRSEIERTAPPASITWLPADRNVEVAAWDGEPVSRGPFRGAVEQLARAVCPEPRVRRRWAFR